MSYIKILVHTVWATKNRIPFLNDNIRKEVIQHIRHYAATKRIFIDHINGEKEHIHALISLAKKQSIAEVMQYLKGESSFWINKNHIIKIPFEWQDDYWAASIGISQLDILRSYIRNQADHHKKESLMMKLIL